MNLFLRRYLFRFILFVPVAWLFIILILLQSNEKSEIHSDSQRAEQVPLQPRRGREIDNAEAFGGDALDRLGHRLIPHSANLSVSKESSTDGPRDIHDKQEQVAAPQLENSKHDINAPGEMGKAFDVNKDKLTPEERRKYDDGFQKNAFNAYVSDMISVHRSLPDVRDPGCRKLPYTAINVTASVVMCFHNEAWSVLLRSIHSILDRSPPHLLKEIILVDDFSDMGKKIILTDC